MQLITSKDNTLIKHICKLKEKKYRKKYCEYVIEGVKLIKEAIEEKVNIKSIVVREGAIETELFKKHLEASIENLDYVVVENNIFKIISDVENPQGVLAIVEKKEESHQIDLTKDFILALDDIQDPGNLGTIIRTADSANLTQILVSKGTADAYNPKVIRSTMGAIFRVKIIECENLALTLEELKQASYDVVVTSLEAKKMVYDLDFNKTVVVIGNEANGVSKAVSDIANKQAVIPMIGKTESLNASVATGIILYEYVKQKVILKEEDTNGRK